jgi:hypothetical protein
MKVLIAFTGAVLISLVGSVAYGATPNVPPFDIEKKIAYQQGQFGGLYAQCGSGYDKKVIGGSVNSWRMETFRGYKGSPVERTGMETAFDEAVRAVANDPNSCQDWIQQAGATWRSIVTLSQGTPTDLHPQVGIK